MTRQYRRSQWYRHRGTHSSQLSSSSPSLSPRSSMYVVSRWLARNVFFFFEQIILDCEFFINLNNNTYNSERVGLANGTTPVDRIFLSFKCSKSQLSRVILPTSSLHWIFNYLGLSPARLRESGGCIREEKDIYFWSRRLSGIHLCLRILKRWAKNDRFLQLFLSWEMF